MVELMLDCAKEAVLSFDPNGPMILQATGQSEPGAVSAPATPVTNALSRPRDKAFRLLSMLPRSAQSIDAKKRRARSAQFNDYHAAKFPLARTNPPANANPLRDSCPGLACVKAGISNPLFRL
jgi:hypothetical protein